MTDQSDQVLRLDAKLASVAKSGRNAMVCFFVRGQVEDLAALSAASDADLLLGIVIAREAATAASEPPD